MSRLVLELCSTIELRGRSRRVLSIRMVSPAIAVPRCCGDDCGTKGQGGPEIPKLGL